MRKAKHVEFIDLFCGAGGSGSGIIEALKALGRPHHGTFINHDPTAIETHEVNHPEHDHYPEDIVKLDPGKYTSDKETTLLWGSPECTHFSIASGCTPKNPQSRAQANSVLEWVREKNPQILLLENVKEFQSWGPVFQKHDPDTGRKLFVRGKDRLDRLPRGLGRQKGESQENHWERLALEGILPLLVPDPKYKGSYYRAWTSALDELGYDVDSRILCAADFGAATIRKRLFVQAVRRDTGLKIHWPKPTHAKCERWEKPPAGLKRWKTAADVVDLTNMGESIFNRERSLAQSTINRLAKGTVRYGFKDFIVPKDQGWDKSNVRSMWEPISTITTRHTGERVARCVLQELDGGRCVQVVNLRNIKLPESMPEIREAIRSVKGCDVTKDFILEYDPVMFECMQDDTTPQLFKTLHEEMQKGEIRALRPWLYLYFSNGPAGSDIDAPVGTIKGRAHIALCSPVVELKGKKFLLDIRLRMLDSGELARAQGFSEDYVWTGNDTAKMKGIGNSVSSYVAKALTLSVMKQQEDISQWMN